MVLVDVECQGERQPGVFAGAQRRRALRYFHSSSNNASSNNTFETVASGGERGRLWMPFAIEAMLFKDDLLADTLSVKFSSRHKLLSVLLCSNVPGYERPECFIVSSMADEYISRLVSCRGGQARHDRHLCRRAASPRFTYMYAVPGWTLLFLLETHLLDDGILTAPMDPDV